MPLLAGNWLRIEGLWSRARTEHETEAGTDLKTEAGLELSRAGASESQQSVVSAAVRQVFVQPDRKNAGEAWRHVADQLRPRFPKVAALLDDAEHDVLAYMDYPEAHRSKLHSTNPIERLNKEVKRRTNVVGIFPNEASVRRLVGAVLLEQNDDWQLQHRYLTLETMTGMVANDETAIAALTTT